MDKAKEAKKEISQLRMKRQNAIDDARITYLEGFIAGSEYAQQVSSPIIEILKVARCPNKGCNNKGLIYYGDGEIGQCQWCDERDKWIKNQQ